MPKLNLKIKESIDHDGAVTYYMSSTSSTVSPGVKYSPSLVEAVYDWWNWSDESAIDLVYDHKLADKVIRYFADQSRDDLLEEIIKNENIRRDFLTWLSE